MSKIKKIYKYTFVLFILLALLGATGYFVLKLPSVQSYLGSKFMNKISRDIDGNIEFTHIHFTYFNNVKVNDFLIRDFSSDTLIYAAYLEAGIRKIKKKERLLQLGRINIESPVIKIKPDTSGSLNLLYYIDFIIPEDTAKRNRELSISQIKISDGSISVISGKQESGNKDLVDFNSLEINELNLNIDGLEKLWKNVSLNLTELSFKTSEGFELTNLFTQVDIGADHYHLIDPTIRTSNSFINSDLIGINFPDNTDQIDLFKDGSLDLQLNTSLLSLTDLAYFIAPLKGYDQELTMSGQLRGSLAELKGRNLNIVLSDTSNLEFDFDLSGLPDIDNTFMFIEVDDFNSHTAEIESINIPGKGYIDLGDELRRIGNISFTGNFTGFITDFVTYGRFKTDIGELSTDILFKPDSLKSFVYSGSLDLKEINIGKLTGIESMLGYSSASFELDGVSESFDHFRANLNGNIDSIHFNNYNYRNIHIDGLFTNRIFDGSISSNSKDLSMDLLGRFDFSDTIPELDFSLNLLSADLFALNFDPGDTTSSLTMLLTANIIGDKLDNLSGEIRMLNSSLSKYGEVLELYDANLSASENNGVSRLDFKTDFIDAELVGDYNLSRLGKDFSNVIYSLAPSLKKESDAIDYISQNSFAYNISLKNSDKLNDFFRTGLRIAPGTLIKGEVFPGEKISLESRGDYLTYNSNSLLDFNINAEVADSILNLNFDSYKANLINRLDLDSLTLNIASIPDSVVLGLKWNQSGSDKQSGDIRISGAIEDGSGNNPLFRARFLPGWLDLNNNRWTVNESLITLDSTSVFVDKFLVNNELDHISINGSVSEEQGDTLYFGFNNLNLGALNSVKAQDIETKKDKVDFIIDGRINGDILLTDIYNNLLFESNLVINNFKTNEHEHGDVTLLSDWNNVSKAAEINIYNDNNGKQTFGINGSYDPANKNLDLLTEVERMPLDILNLLLHSFASGINGYASGTVVISGEPSAPLINGNVLAEDASMVIDYLQTRFMFSDTIKMRDHSFVFDSIGIRDDKGNDAMLHGSVSHTAYKNYVAGIRIDADNMRVLDTRQKDNDLFFGTAFATGVINILGEEDGLELKISAVTEKNTKVFIPLNSSEEVSDYSFISFLEPSVDSISNREITLPIRLPEKTGGLGLDFNLDVTQDAEIQLVFDASVGDALRSTGSGNLNMSLGKDGNFSMFGDYTIEDGHYQLTLGNIFNKRFIVEDGGKITWNGDITNAEMDIKAIYKLKASLYELLMDPSYKERIPVECHLNMSGQLVNPIISFDIYLPTADEKTRTDLRNAINSDEEMSRQFLYLLVMNSFYPDPSFADASGATNTGASAMGVTTTEMLTNQLSNWLSQISNDFDIGFAYRPGNDISSQEVEVALSTQLLDDRVTINGNFAVAGQETSSTMNDLTGDFDVEVKLTEKVRFKVFNRSNDNRYYETAPYTQGFGFFFRQEFDKFRDIFKRKNKDIRKEDDIEAIDIGK